MGKRSSSGHRTQMYDELAGIAAGRPLCCEFNLVPPNPASLAFHDRLGFAACGEADDPRNGKRVRLASISAIAPPHGSLIVNCTGPG